MEAKQILDNLLSDLGEQLGDDTRNLSDFIKQQAEGLATQAELIARERVDGVLSNNESLYQYFLTGLENDTLNMARAVAQSTALTIEKAWNTIVKAIWDALDAVIGIAAIPLPLRPSLPGPV